MRRLIRFLFFSLLVVLIVVPLIVGTTLVMALSDHALVPIAQAPGPSDVARGKRLFARYDPRKLKDGTIENAVLSAADLKLLANHAITLIANGGTTVEIGAGWLKGRASAELPRNPLGRYLNVELDLQAHGVLARFERLRIGSVTVPGWLANLIAEQALNLYFEQQGVGLMSEFIQAVEFVPQRLLVSYRWSRDAVERIRTRLVSPQSAAQLRAFHDRLVEVAGTYRNGAKVSLLEFMKPLFAFAQQRSESENAEAENSAAILILSAYVNGRSVKALVTGAERWPRLNPLTLTLNGRRDSAQHYLTSAALTALGSGALSNAVGLFKEVEDSRGGSGFSFNDLAADRAGTRFAELATVSHASAQKAQLRITQAQGERDIMPDVSDLAERMSEAQFKQRYGGVDSPTYRRVTEDIERRITATRMFR